MNGVTDAPDLTAEFDELGPHLRGVAYRMLGSVSETEEVLDLVSWSTRAVARTCLLRLRARAERRETPRLEDDLPELDDPALEAHLADEAGVALLATLEPLSPAERVAYVLHDLLGHHFEDVAGVLGRTSAATRELAARARARVTDGATSETAAEDAERRVHGALVAGVLGAASSRDDEGLRALLADDVRLRADAAAVGAGVEVYREGRADVAETVAGLAGSARLVRLDGYAAAEVDLDGTRAVVGFVLDRAHAVELDVIAEPAVLDLLDLRAG